MDPCRIRVPFIIKFKLYSLKNKVIDKILYRRYKMSKWLGSFSFLYEIIRHQFEICFHIHPSDRQPDSQSSQSKLTSITLFSYGPVQVKPYDWYGAYGNLRHSEYGYKERLNLDYTFDHPEIHENVSSCLFLKRSHATFIVCRMRDIYSTSRENVLAP